jgi:hypothetical protein
MSSFKRGSSIAAAAAGIAMATLAQAADTAQPFNGRSIHANDEVHCFNACKGQSDCHTATNDCKTLNECKGKGWKAMTAGRCFSRRGFIGDVH